MNASYFTSHFVCSINITRTCKIILSLPNSNNFLWLIFTEIPRQSAWGGGIITRLPWYWLLLWRVTFVKNAYSRNLCFWYPRYPCVEISWDFIVWLMFSVLYTKNVLNSAKLIRYSTTFYSHFAVFLRIG